MYLFKFKGGLAQPSNMSVRAAQSVFLPSGHVMPSQFNTPCGPLYAAIRPCHLILCFALLAPSASCQFSAAIQGLAPKSDYQPGCIDSLFAVAQRRSSIAAQQSRLPDSLARSPYPSPAYPA